MKFHGFDWLRVAGVLAVIYIHGCETNETARRGMKWLGFAVPCFFLMSSFLLQTSLLHRSRPYWDIIRKKFARLAPPFLAWSVVYLAVRGVKSLVVGSEVDSTLWGSLFWGDASYQLYFVPMLFYSFVAWTGVMLLGRKHPWIASAICVIVTAICVTLESQIDSFFPANRWFISKNLVWFPVGMLFAIAFQRGRFSREQCFWPSIAGLALILLLDFVNVYALTLATFALSLSITRQTPGWIQQVGVYSFGIYLSHVLFLESMQFVTPRFGVSVSALSTTIALTVLTAILSFATCWLLGRSSRTRWSVR